MFTDDTVTLFQSHRIAASALGRRRSRAPRRGALAALHRRMLEVEVRALSGALAHARAAQLRDREA